MVVTAHCRETHHLFTLFVLACVEIALVGLAADDQSRLCGGGRLLPGAADTA